MGFEVRDVKYISDENTILLKQYKKHTNYIKSSGSSASEEKYLINIGDLIASIKEKGEKVKCNNQDMM